jgi:hypothetical protein
VMLGGGPARAAVRGRCGAHLAHMRVSNGGKDRKRLGVFALVRARVADVSAGGADELAYKPDSVAA